MFFVLTQGHFFTAFQKEREEGRNRSTVRDKHRLVASHMRPDWGSYGSGPGTEPAAQACDPTGN